MTNWTTFTAEAPELAALAERRMGDTGLVLLATIRRDGFPRISPLEPLLHDGKLRLGMMPQSTKALDLRREPRCAIHTATIDKDVKEGDVKMWGRAVEATDPDDVTAYADALHAATGFRPEPGQFHLFDLDLRGVSSAEIAGDAMRITTWRPGHAVRSELKKT